MKEAKELKSSPVKRSKLLIVLISIAVALALLVTGLIVTNIGFQQKPVQDVQESVEASIAESVPVEEPEADTEPASAAEEASLVEESTIIEVETTEMLPVMAQLYAANQDIFGWLRVDDTTLNCPVMYTPEEREKYLRKDFEGQYSLGGEPFIDEDCSVDPESDNLIIYGHNMSNGSQFGTLMEYAQKSYWEEHPYITFYTLYEERAYEIISCFYDHVYYKSEDVFKFYQFIDAEDEAAFDEAITYYRAKAEYDTGVTAEFGDQLITLVTCSNHSDTGRFVVVAKEVELASEDAPVE